MTIEEEMLKTLKSMMGLKLGTENGNGLSKLSGNQAQGETCILGYLGDHCSLKAMSSWREDSPLLLSCIRHI